MTKARELGVTEFPYIEYDANGYMTYYEEESGYWESNVLDENGHYLDRDTSNIDEYVED